jgi:hypothetical protein
MSDAKAATWQVADRAPHARASSTDGQPTELLEQGYWSWLPSRIKRCFPIDTRLAKSPRG